jgi:hypothetical protein
MKTTKFKVSPYVEYVMSGSDIINLDPDTLGGPGGGYDPLIAEEYHRSPKKPKGTYVLTRNALLDLAEFCQALAISESQSENYSGARSLDKHAERAFAAARELEASS